MRKKSHENSNGKSISTERASQEEQNSMKMPRESRYMLMIVLYILYLHVSLLQ